MSVDAVMKVIDPATATSVDLRDIKIVKKLGGTIDDCELVESLVLTQKVANSGITRVEKTDWAYSVLLICSQNRYGQSNSSFWLCSDGSSAKRRESLYSKFREANLKNRM